MAFSLRFLFGLFSSYKHFGVTFFPSISSYSCFLLTLTCDVFCIYFSLYFLLFNLLKDGHGGFIL